jgi:hypothetical protein
MEVRGTEKQGILVGGPYQCILEVFDDHIHQTLWKQKSSAQFTTKPPIIFGDIFKVKNVNGDWGLDIKPEYLLKVQFCKVEEKHVVQLDSGTICLESLIVNKDNIKEVKLDEGKAVVVLKLNISNSHYPRTNTFTLGEIAAKEREKEAAKEKEKEAAKETTAENHRPQTLTRTSSYHLPRIGIKFSIHYQTVPGEEVRIVGAHSKLGDWDPWKAPVLEWTNGGVWVKEIGFRKASFPVEYKYVVVNPNNGSVSWETVGNRKVEYSDDLPESFFRNDHWNTL